MIQKTVFLVIAIIMGTCCYSQCGKKNILSATGAEILNEHNEIKIKDTQRVTSVVYDTKVFEVISGNSTLSGTIDSIFCNWKIPFIDGNTFIKGILNFENGEQRVTTLTITGKDGKLTLLVYVEDPQASIMRFVLDKFEETK